MALLQLGAWMCGAAALSAVLTILSIRYALYRDILDHPGLRRSHSAPTPRGGGVAILAVVLIALFCLPLPQIPAIALGLSVAAVGLIGWWDDHYSLPVLPRLAVHVLAGLMLALGFLDVQKEVSAALIAVLIAVAFVSVAAINFCNFMDGINGIASSQAALVFSASALLLWPEAAPWATLYAIAAAACLGFLPFNFPRARIFLGDVGSGAIGLLVAAALIQVWLSTRLHPAALFLLVSAFALDAGLTLAQRILQGKRWYKPHREHLFQWWVREGQSHTAVSVRYAVWTLLMMSLVFAGRAWPDQVWNLLGPVLIAVSGLGWWMAKRRLLIMKRGRGRPAKANQ